MAGRARQQPAGNLGRMRAKRPCGIQVAEDGQRSANEGPAEVLASARHVRAGVGPAHGASCECGTMARSRTSWATRRAAGGPTKQRAAPR